MIRHGDKIQVVGNGIDLEKFHPVDKHKARKDLGIGDRTKVLITIGALVERKGFHRVLEILPLLKTKYPDIIYLAVGGASAEGDLTDHLKLQVKELKLEQQSTRQKS